MDKREKAILQKRKDGWYVKFEDGDFNRITDWAQSNKTIEQIISRMKQIPANNNVDFIVEESKRNNIMNKIFERKDLTLYKRLLNVLGEYDAYSPATGISGLFHSAIENGMRILPKDQFALSIIKYVLTNDSASNAVHNLQNMRFSDLPASYRPLIKAGRRHEVAFWTRDKNISDKVIDLIDFEATGKSGMWSDVKGDKQKIVDLNPVDESKLNESVQTDIKNYKERLIRKAKTNGSVWEDFGQPEVRTLEGKYRDHQYTRDGVWNDIREFDNWCQNFDLSQLK